MDINKLVDVLRATLQPDQREAAEKQLSEVHKIIGFVPALLQLVMSEPIDMPVRQAGVVYMKNMISSNWEVKEESHTPDVNAFVIHENDKQLIRDHIIEAVIASNNLIRVQLAVCVSHIVKHDFPGKWPLLAEKIHGYLKSDRHDTWHGALLCLYQLVKNFEYKKPEEKKFLYEPMMHLLPLIHQICMQLIPDASEPSVTIQKQILKVFFALIQFHLPMDLVTQPTFTMWMELARQIADRPIPEDCNQVDEDDRPDLIWWKCKKWSLHILTRCFERYGSPGNVMKDYKDFAEWFLRTFSAGILDVLLRLLDLYRNKQYIAPRILQLVLNYLTQAVNHSLSWKIIKPHMQAIIHDVIFPLMCHSDEDEELWQSDPVEYIRVKYDVYEEFFNPSMGAQTLLHSSASKRKEVLQKTMGFIVQVLTSQNLSPRHKSGALHMVGALASVLLQKKIYKDQVELMMVNHVYPEFSSPNGYLRARACWVVNSFSEVKFKNVDNLKVAVDCIRTILSTDKELPVRVEAATSIQMLLSEQEKAKELLKPHVRQVILDLLNLIHDTENDDLTNVLQKFVCEFSDDIAPIAVEITTHLAQTFTKVLESNTDSSDDKALTAMGILNTLETICSVMEEQKEIMVHIEGVVIEVIGVILLHNVSEFFEEMLSLVFSLTSQQISSRMWQTLPLIFDLFNKDNVDYFTDMMPALHNYITVDPHTFLSDAKYMEIIFTMCKTVLHSDAGEDAEAHAAKLLEVVLLQYKGLIDQVVPSFVELALERLTREVRTTELRTMCLQVVVAALYYNPQMLLELLQKPLANTGSTILAQFITQWLNDADCFLGLHDRKMFVLGLCTLLSMSGGRPPFLNDEAHRILPSLILVFKGLKRAYEYKSKEDEDSDEEEEEEGEDDLDDEEDVIDDESEQYMEKLEKVHKEGEDSEDDDDDDDDDESEETALESYETPLDKEDCDVEEYQIFKSVLENIKVADPTWYLQLVNNLNEDSRKDLDEIYRLADQKRAAAESKRIELAGGYMFTQTTVPSSFNFGTV